jgi:CheY-like chemotaxis protein
MVFPAPPAGDISGRILIVDSDDAARAEFRQFASDRCDIIEAADGREAMARAFVRRPSGVITELRLPFVDGCSLCEVLRSDAMTRHVPLVVVTGEDRARPLEQARAIADAVFVKPVQALTVLGALSQLIARSATLKQQATNLNVRAGAAIATSRQLVHTQTGRQTTRPPAAPPHMECPGCRATLQYEYSYVVGVNVRRVDQWDYFVCPRELTHFQYRHRPRTLRRVTALSVTPTDPKHSRTR